MLTPQNCTLSGDKAVADVAALYESLITESTEVAVFLMDPQGCIVSWNCGVERLLGYREPESISRPGHITFTPEFSAEIFHEDLARAARSGRTTEARWHQRKDGRRVFLESTTTALRDATRPDCGVSGGQCVT